MKQCNVCYFTYSLNHFYRNKKYKDGYQWECKSCHSRYAKASYERDKPTVLAKQREYYKQNRERIRCKFNKFLRDKRAKTQIIIDQLKQRPCHDCQGWFPSTCMEFDHREPEHKNAAISELVGTADMKIILEEIKKCDVVCANCHAIRTWNQRLHSDLRRW